MRFTLIVIAVLVLCSSPILGQRPLDVSMVSLLATPEKFDGQLIRVCGFLRLEFEGNALYFHKEDYDHGLYQNSVWVNLAESKENMKLNLRYVFMEGVFRAKDHGHLGLFGGTIDQIKRVQPLR